VLLNGTIMTIYLWHLTVLVLLVGLAHWAGNVGLFAAPNTAAWWSLRPAWIAVLAAALFGLVGLLGRFEHPRAVDEAAVAPAWRLVAGALLTGYGLALLALEGIAGDGWLGLRPLALALPFAGAWLAGIWRR